MIDFEELSARSLDEPITADEQAALRVWADALEDAGDARGPLIAMEHALRDQPSREHELRPAMNEHMMTHVAHALGAIAPFLRFPRALSFDCRSGWIYGAFFDTRYLSERAKLSPGKLVSWLLGAPMMATLRRLHVRVRVEQQVNEVMGVLGKLTSGPALEELVVLTGVRVTQVAGAGRSLGEATLIPERYPNLRLLAGGTWVAVLPLPAPTFQSGDARLARLLPTADPATFLVRDAADWGLHQGGDARLARLLPTANPATAEGRCTLGRSLLRAEPVLRTRALDRLAELGERAFMFAESLMILLGPGIVTPQAPIVACLAALGDRARIALPMLATITGRVAHYDHATRRSAGVAIAALRG